MGIFFLCFPTLKKDIACGFFVDSIKLFSPWHNCCCWAIGYNRSITVNDTEAVDEQKPTAKIEKTTTKHRH